LVRRAPERPCRKGVDPPNLPNDIAIAAAPNGRTLEDMFAAGELDALLSNYIPDLFLQRASGITRLFPDYKAIEQDYYRRTRIFPVMHIVVLRADIYRRDPWVATSLYRAFCQAKTLALEGLYDSDALHLAFPWLLDHIEEAEATFGRDYWSYGVEANRPAFEAIGRYLFEQGLAPRAVAAEELFARRRATAVPIAPNPAIPTFVSGIPAPPMLPSSTRGLSVSLWPVRAYTSPGGCMRTRLSKRKEEEGKRGRAVAAFVHQLKAKESNHVAISINLRIGATRRQPAKEIRPQGD
jgi:hypothetical protein